MFKKILDVFLFSSLYISLCAVVMVWQTTWLLDLSVTRHYSWFVFFSTICSYNFHWLLTPKQHSPVTRLDWIPSYRIIQVVLICISAIGAAYFFFSLWQHAHWLMVGVLLTFLYSAPKLPVKASNVLKKIAIGKTIYLSFVWTYVTTVLPLLIEGEQWNAADLSFVASRFFLIYAICILFDFRDREQDRQEGIRSMITYFNERGVDIVFYLSLALFFIATGLLMLFGFSLLMVLLLGFPGLLVAALHPYSKKASSDYLYFFVLDGLMMLSALIIWFINL